MRRLLDSELDAIRKDPSREPDERLDAHLELERRGRVRSRISGVYPAPSSMAVRRLKG